MPSPATFSRFEPGLQPARDIPQGTRVCPSGQLKDRPGNVFDPKQHLQIVPPTAIKTLAFNTIPFPYKPEDVEDFPGMAYVTDSDDDVMYCTNRRDPVHSDDVMYVTDRVMMSCMYYNPGHFASFAKCADVLPRGKDDEEVQSLYQPRP